MTNRSGRIRWLLAHDHAGKRSSTAFLMFVFSPVGLVIGIHQRETLQMLPELCEQGGEVVRHAERQSDGRCSTWLEIRS